MNTQRSLMKRMANYIERNKKLPPLASLQYKFLRELYMYLTRQVLSKEFKENLYINYTLVVDKYYSINRDVPNKEMQEIIYLQFLNLLYRDSISPMTFIQLNSVSHYEKMVKVIEILHAWATNPEYYGYASEKEFWEIMDFLRKEFDKDKNDFNYAVGKWPKKLKKRKGQK